MLKLVEYQNSLYNNMLFRNRMSYAIFIVLNLRLLVACDITPEDVAK